MTRVLAASRIATLLGEFDRDPAYKGLAEGLRVLITDGRVPVGARLPSERELTDAVAVSRTTVTRAYAELRDHGFLVSRQGSGSVASLPANRGHLVDHVLHPGTLDEGQIDLTVAAPAPGPGVLAAYERATEQLPAYLAGSGYFPCGLRVLREAVAATYDARGLPTDPEQIMVVPGAQAGVAIAARALLSVGDRAVVESPTYPNAIATLTALGRTPRRCRRPARRGCADARGRRARRDARAGRAEGRLPDPRLPQPHRRADDRRAAGAGRHGTEAGAHDGHRRRVDGGAGAGRAGRCRHRSRRTPPRRSPWAA